MRYDAGPPHGFGDYSGRVQEGVPHGKVSMLDLQHITVALGADPPAPNPNPNPNPLSRFVVDTFNEIP